MKKTLSILSLAVAAALTASAATPVSKSSIQDASVSSSILTEAPVMASGLSMQKVGAKKNIAKVEDLYGAWSCNWYYWLLTGDDKWGGQCSPYVTEGETPNTITVVGWPYSDVELTGIVDWSAKTITFKEGETSLYLNNYNEYMKFVGEKGTITPDPETGKNKISFKEGGDFVLNIVSEGLYNETDGFALRVTEGYFFCAAGYELIPLNMFEYNPAEWKSAGTAKFTDAVFNNFFKADYQVGEVEVPAYKKLGTEGVFMLLNPYQQGGWSQLNAINTEGYLYIDASYPDCTLLMPLTPSGFGIDEAEEGEEPMIFEYYPYNKEAYSVVIEGYDIEDVEMEYLATESPISTYDEDTQTAKIVNIFFGDDMNPLTSYWFGETKPLSYTIVFNLVGVNEVEFDNNAPVKYFNLQGMEVANPAKGELVIMTQGSKAKKVVIR